MSRALGRIAFFGGGTGGHLTPGLAVAERAAERFPGCGATFFRTRRATDERVLKGEPFESETLEIESPRGVLGRAACLCSAWRLARRLGPRLRQGYDAVIGLGGYASLPGVLAARRQGLPVVLLEQNRIPGRVNRWLAPWVGAVSCPDPETARRIRGRGEVTGNPVRRRVIEAAARRRAARGSLERGGVRRRVLVVGGSQGAHGVNQRVVDALRRLEAYRDRISWLHVTGDADREAVASAYRAGGWDARVEPFLADLPARVAESDLVVARSGGTTLAELSVLGVPAILVPYPHHRDHHQLANARAQEEAGGAVVVEERDLDDRVLVRCFREVLFEPSRLEAMEEGASRRARPDAADAVLDLVLELRERCRQGSGCFS